MMSPKAGVAVSSDRRHVSDVSTGSHFPNWAQAVTMAEEPCPVRDHREPLPCGLLESVMIALELWKP